MNDLIWQLLPPLLLVAIFLFALSRLKRLVNKAPLSGARECGKCQTPAPTMRVPDTLHQALWGGWTCAGCGATVDARGEPVPDAAPRPPSKPIGGFVARRPGLLMGLGWGLAMWLGLSVAPETFAWLRGATFQGGKVALGLLICGVGGGLFFGSVMRKIIFGNPKP
jgi:hypothetical protein